MNQINNSKKIYHAAIYVRLSKEDGDVATAGKRESNSEYSCAVTPQIRQMGNHLSGNAGTAYASLLA